MTGKSALSSPRRNGPTTWLAMHEGRPYKVGFVPRLREGLAQFRQRDADFAALAAEVQAEAPSPTVMDEIYETLSSRRWLWAEFAPSIEQASDALHVLSDPKPGVRALFEAHRLLTGHADPLRQGPAWVDAAHPAEAWYVAPPADDVLPALADLAAFLDDRSLSPTLRALVGMKQLVMIRPFKVGNTRIARCLAAARLRHANRLSERGFTIVRQLSEHRDTAFRESSIAIRDRGDWGPFLTCALMTWNS